MLKNIRNKLVEYKNTNTWLLFIWNECKRIQFSRQYSKYSDRELIQKLYFEFSGQIPEIDNPVLFSEKLQYLKLFYRDDTLTKCVDKFSVRSFVESKGYSDILNELLQEFDNIDDFDLDSLPESFVLKGAHGSGWNLICKNKTLINWFPWKLVMKSWLKQNIYYNGREWPYKNVTPRIVIEKYLEDSDGELKDYKFHCFHGKPLFIQINTGRFTKLASQNFYDPNWRLQPFGKDLSPNLDVEIPRPKNFHEMMKVAEDLSEEFPYVRVDLYNVSEKIIFGELTFYPASGLPDFVPSKYDEIWGELLNITSININEKK
mgnify:CR=1 FL=1